MSGKACRVMSVAVLGTDSNDRALKEFETLTINEKVEVKN